MVDIDGRTRRMRNICYDSQLKRFFQVQSNVSLTDKPKASEGKEDGEMQTAREGDKRGKREGAR